MHVCCAPCAIYPVEAAKKDNFTVTGFFYNPNIHPYPEYIRRRKEAEAYFRSEGLEEIFLEYNAASFFKNVTGNETPPGRCSACWDMRLEKTALFAKENRFDAFTTTLLASPYQDHHILKNSCENLSKEKGVDFYYKDFRTGFRQSHRLAKERGMYCQNYCGCVFSMVEREEAKYARNR